MIIIIYMNGNDEKNMVLLNYIHVQEKIKFRSVVNMVNLNA